MSNSDDQIRAAIARLAELSESSDAALDVRAEDPSEGLQVTGNPAGLARLATGLLRAAIEPIRENDSRSGFISVDLGPWTDDAKGDFLTFCTIQRLDQWPEPPATIEQRQRRRQKNDRVALVGCALISVLIASIMAGGVAYWWLLFTGAVKL